MTASYTQQVTRFSKINHAYFFIEAARRKDYLQVCRHFLWQLNRGNNQPLTQTSIVSTIAELTKHFGLNIETIKKSLSQMKKAGEIEGFKGISNRVGWNPVVTNQMRWTNFKSSYSGNEIVPYSKAEQDVVDKLLEMSKPISYMPRDKEDFEHTQEVEQMTMLRQEIAMLRQDSAKIREESSEIKALLQEVLKVVKKYEPAEAEKIERKLVDVSTGKEYVQ
jgi:hypothetical protein